jgi:hypothetical protein
MRRLLLFTGILITASGITWAFNAKQKPPEKTYSVTLPLSKWIEITNRLEAVKDVIRQSDVQARQATFVCDSILNPLQLTIGQQVNAQIQQETKKDTVLPKRK